MRKKICTKCKKERDVKEFSNASNAKDGLFSWCKECASIHGKKWNGVNKKKYPWINSYNLAKQRCNNPNNESYKTYGARCIKFLLSKEDMAFIWNRDKADLMEYPTIDRIKNKGNYELNNCQFLENKENSLKDRTHPKIGQYDLKGNLIKVWYSQGQAARELGISQADISHCVNNKKVKKVNGFKWRKIL